MRLSYQGDAAIAEVTTLPGSSQVAVIHGAFVKPECRSMGVGNVAHRTRLEELRVTFAYDAAICTARMDNTPQLRILERNGWTKAVEFTSRSTGNRVGIFVKALID